VNAFATAQEFFEAFDKRWHVWLPRRIGDRPPPP